MWFEAMESLSGTTHERLNFGVANPVVGDTDERFCGAHTLYHADGSHPRRAKVPVLSGKCPLQSLIRQSQPTHQILKARIRTQWVEGREADARHKLRVLFCVRLLQILERFIAI